VINHRYTADELRSVISQAEDLIGNRLEDLVRRYQLGATSVTPPRHQNRLVQLLLRLQRAADRPNDGLAESAAVLAIVEVSGILETLERWRSDPVWPEFQAAIQDPRDYLHAVTTLTVASALKERHPGTLLVASGSAGRSPDLRMVVTDQHNLAVEVKSSLSLGQRASPMHLTEAVELVEKSIKGASTGFRGQLATGTPGVLVIGGFNIDAGTFAALGDAAGQVLSRGRWRSHLLAIVISHTRLVPPRVENGRVSVGLAHETRIRSNPRYIGHLRFIGDWGGDWRLELSR